MLTKETCLFKDILDLTIQGQVQGFGLIIFSAKMFLTSQFKVKFKDLDL